MAIRPDGWGKNWPGYEGTTTCCSVGDAKEMETFFPYLVEGHPVLVEKQCWKYRSAPFLVGKSLTHLPICGCTVRLGSDRREIAASSTRTGRSFSKNPAQKTIPCLFVLYPYHLRAEEKKDFVLYIVVGRRTSVHLYRQLHERKK